MFGFGKKKHAESYSDVRSHVLNEKPSQPAGTIADRLGIERPPAGGPPPIEPSIAHNEPNETAFGERPDPRTESFEMERPQNNTNNYEILDRLHLIESQLAAIRSQTETINERLKNMDARISGRRY